MARKASDTPKRKPTCITIDDETKDRLRCYAYQHRMNISQAITYLIWDVPNVDMSLLSKINGTSDTGADAMSDHGANNRYSHAPALAYEYEQDSPKYR